jgi:4-hydroxybenzoate polyprenyltransferase
VKNELAVLIARYTALRIALFAIVVLSLLFTPLPGIVDVAIALVVSGVVSLFIGREHRDRMVAAWETRQQEKAAEARRR